MGKMNTAMCHFFSNRKRFADLFNGIFFRGEETIRESDLQRVSEQYATVGDELQERCRDIKMYLNTGETLRILALENQNKTDYTLPYRCMQYDSLEYGKQLDELKQYNKENHCLKTAEERLSGVTKSDRLTPVYTVCLYHGEEPWDGPLTLRDMMDFGENEDGMSRFFTDYPMRLFCVNEQADFSMFHTEIREVFTALAYRRNKAEFRKRVARDTAFRRLDRDTVQVLSVLLNIPELWKDREKFMTGNEEEEEYDMCQAWQELLEDAKGEGLNQGLSQGLSQGIDVINILFQKLLADNRLEDLKRSVMEPAFQRQLLTEYHLLQ